MFEACLMHLPAITLAFAALTFRASAAVLIELFVARVHVISVK